MKMFAAMLAGVSMLLLSQNGIAGKVTGYQIDEPHIVLFAIRKGDITKLSKGTNNVGEPIDFTCNNAAGCLLTSEGFGIRGNIDSLTVLLDGVPMSPAITNTEPFQGLQSAAIGMGSHTIQIQAVAPSKRHYSSLRDWEFRFVAYEP